VDEGRGCVYGFEEVEVDLECEVVMMEYNGYEVKGTWGERG